MISVVEEQEALAACRKGNLQAFTPLYEAYAQNIYRFLFYRVFSRETAEDLTSKTFMKALEKIQLYDPRKGAFSSWLYRIARNTLIDHVRADRPSLDIETVFSLGEESTLSEQSDAKEKLRKVWAYLETLPLEQRNVVLMRAWDGLSYREIADILGKSEGSCKVMFSRTIAKIQKEMPLALVVLAGSGIHFL